MEKVNKPIISEVHTYKEVYEKKCFLLASRYKKVYEENMGADLVIITDNNYNNIIINGKKYKQQDGLDI